MTLSLELCDALVFKRVRWLVVRLDDGPVFHIHLKQPPCQVWALPGGSLRLILSDDTRLIAKTDKAIGLVLALYLDPLFVPEGGNARLMLPPAPEEAK